MQALDKHPDGDAEKEADGAADGAHQAPESDHEVLGLDKRKLLYRPASKALIHGVQHVYVVPYEY